MNLQSRGGCLMSYIEHRSKELKRDGAGITKKTASISRGQQCQSDKVGD